MQFRQLGANGPRVSIIGFGGWGIGGKTAGATSYGDTNDRESARALNAAFDAGINFFETANVYGNGRSEELIGEAFRGQRDRVVLATKIGMLPSYRGVDFAPSSLRRALEGSLARLRTDHVDLLMLHDGDPGTLAAHPEIAETMRAFCAKGKTRAFGLSARTPADGLAFLAEPGIACIEVNFHLLDRRALDCGLLVEAARRNIGLIARTPLASGFLAGSFERGVQFSPDDHRSRWTKERIALWLDAADAIFAALGCARDKRPQEALRFCLSFPEIATAIPGIMTETEAGTNAAAGALPQLGDAALAAAAAAYERFRLRLAV